MREKKTKETQGNGVGKGLFCFDNFRVKVSTKLNWKVCAVLMKACITKKKRNGGWMI